MARSSMLPVFGLLLSACAPPAARSTSGDGVVRDAVARVCELTDWGDARLPELHLGHASAPRDASLSPGAKWVATAGADGARLWELATGRLMPIDPPGTRFCDDDHVVGTPPGAVVSLSLSSGRLTQTARSEGDLLSPDGCVLARVDPDALRFIDTSTGLVTDERQPAPSQLYSGDVDAVFTVARTSSQETWSWTTKRPLERLRRNGEGEGSLTQSPDGRYLCHAGYTGIRVVELTSGKLVLEQRVPEYAGSFSSGMKPPTTSNCTFAADGSRVAFTAIRPDGFGGFAPSKVRLTVLDLRGKRVGDFDLVGVQNIAFSADAARLRVDTWPDLGGPHVCAQIELASATVGACDDALPRQDGVAIDGTGRVVARVAGHEQSFEAVRSWATTSSLPATVAELETAPGLLLQPRGDVLHLLELPSRRRRATLSAQPRPRWIGKQAVLFDDGPGRFVGYRVDTCEVLRVGMVRVGEQTGFIATTGVGIDADALGQTLLQGRSGADDTPLDGGLVRRFLGP